MTLPFDGVRVLDLSLTTSGPFCTRILADYGADVVKIEPPGGDPARMMPPFAGDEPGLERSGLFLFLNTNKRSVVLDLERPEDRDRVLALAREADVVVENFAPGTMQRLGLGYEALAAVNPRVILTSITSFGQDGPYRDWQATDLTVYAMGGAMLGAGDVDHEPLKLAGHWATYYAGYVGALATAVALHAAERRGVGEHVDVSAFEAHTHSIDLRLMYMLLYQYTGRSLQRAGRVGGLGHGLFPCLDGHFFLSGGGHPAHIPGILRMIGREDLLATSLAAGGSALQDLEYVDELNASLIPWLLDHTKKEIRDACQAMGVLGAPLNTVADVVADANFAARQFFHEIDHPSTGPILYPGYHVRLHREGEATPPRRRAPLLGEHTEEVLAAIPEEPPPPVPPVAPASVGLPLEGVRILDLSLVFAGPYGTMQLADWGAEVIRVESRQHFQPITRGLIARPTSEMVRAGKAVAWYPDDDPGEHPWNRAANFNSQARNKKSMTLDFTRPEGWALFEQLVRSADGVYENNLPASIERVGITWERLSQINPKLVMVRVPAFGIDGPYRDYRTLGYHMEALVGHPAIRAYPHLDMDYAPVGIAPDAAAGLGGALGFVMGLRYRDRTGKGLLVELASAENIVPLLGEFIMDYTMNRRVAEKLGNTHPVMAPHNVYRCYGGDRWVAIAVEDDERFRRLAGIIGQPALGTDPRFADAASRRAHGPALDALIEAWTVQREAHWVMERLQHEGIAAGALMSERDILTDPQHGARGFFVDLDSLDAGRRRYAGRLWKASRTPPDAPILPPPMLGEHNDYVYRELLGCSEEEVARLTELGHIGMDYAPNIP